MMMMIMMMMTINHRAMKLVVTGMPWPLWLFIYLCDTPHQDT